MIKDTDGSMQDVYLDHSAEVINVEIMENSDGSTFLVLETGLDSFGQGGDFYSLQYADGSLQVVAG